MKNKMPPSEALVAYLKEIPEALRSPQIYPQLVEAAGRVKTATEAAVIFKLLGSGGSCGSKIPQKPLRFPYDHRLHLEMGTEWYWLSCNLEVEGSNGLDRIGILVVIARNRTVSLDVQKVAGWSDEEVQVVDSAATITVATRTESFIVRRRPNVQWPAVGGKVKFETDPFLYQNGPDYLKGSVNVLPLTVHVDDAPNLTIDLKMSSDLPVEKAFFLQGDGTGITPEPKPGFYYSWPQLSVKGKVSVGGKKYAVKGTGWIDHQLLMSEISKPETTAVPRALGWVPTQTFNGWSWCQFNLSNGDALAVAAFQVGMLRDILEVPYGWYLRRASDHWEQIYLVGSLEIDRFIPGLKEILMPSAWTYELIDKESGGELADIGLMAVPWYPDGSFQTGDLGVPGETPVNVALVDRAPQNAATGIGKGLTGTGYCESVGYEPVEKYVERALAFLKAN